MSMRNASIIVDAKLAADYFAAPKSKQRKALSAMRQALRATNGVKAAPSRLSRRETELFLQINRALPGEKQQRYDQLTEKRLDETLTKQEHAELLGLIEELQQIQIERLQAVLDLAKLRKVSPREMMKQLGVDPEKYG